MRAFDCSSYFLLHFVQNSSQRSDISFFLTVLKNFILRNFMRMCSGRVSTTNQNSHQHLRKKILQSWILRITEKFFRGLFLQDFTLINKENPISYLLGKAHLVSYNYHSHSFICQALHQIQHLSYHLRIQSTGWLIKENHIRIHSQGPDNRYTLLLTTRQRGRIYICLILQSNSGK